jgi:two-component system, cell cycle response regulator DivK
MSKATILIVEDNLDISQPLTDAFRFGDFKVLQAFTAIEALQFASLHRPDLILMDIQLPDLDGLSVADTLKNDPDTQHIPIVAMTAYDVVGNQAKAISRTCVGYAQKPARPRDLINLVSAILKLQTGPEPRRSKDPILRTSRK